LVEHLAPLGHLLAHLGHGVHHGGVIAPAEYSGDGGVAEVGLLSYDVHADLAGLDEAAMPAFALQFFDVIPEHLRGRVHDDVWGDRPGVAIRDDVTKDPLGEIHRDRLVGQAGVCAHSDEGTLQLTDVVPDDAGDELEDIGRNLTPFELGFLAQNRDTSL